MAYHDTQNPGIGGLSGFTNQEIIFLTTLADLSYSDGDILYSSGGVLTRLPIGSTGQVLKVIGGFPAWGAGGGGSGSSTFIGLLDVPASFTGQSLKAVRVNVGETALEFYTPSSGSGTVSSVSVTTANGVSGTVANPTSTPAITLTLGAITPSSVASTGTVTGTNLSGTNTGDQTITLTGDATGSGTGSFAVNVGKINGVALSSLATGILKNTTTTGVPSIAVAGDFPVLNQNTTGTAAGLTTGRTISMTGDVSYTSPAFDGTSNITASATIQPQSVTYSKIQNVSATSKILGRVTAGAGSIEELTATQAKTILAITNSDVSGLGTLATQNGTFSGTSSGTNTGDQTITLTGDVTGSGTGSFAATLATVNTNVGSFTNASITVNGNGLITAASSGTAPVTSVSATGPITSSGGTTPAISTSMNTNKLIGRGTAGTGVMEEITLGTNLSLSGTTLNATGGGSTDYTFWTLSGGFF